MEVINFGDLSDSAPQTIDLGDLSESAAGNKEMEHFRAAQRALAQSPQWQSADDTGKKRLTANLQDTVFGGGYVKAQERSEYKPESFAKGLGRKAIRFTGATLGGLAGGLAAAPTVIGMGPGATAGTMAGYGFGKAAEEALLGQEPAPPPRERVFKGGTLKQGLAEAVYNLPESAANLAEGAVAFPSALGKAAMTPGGGAQVIKDTAHMFGAPLGFYGAEAAKDAWVLDPAGSALAPTMIAGGIKGIKNKGMAEPQLNKYIAKKYPNAVGMSSVDMRRFPDIQRHITDAQEAIKIITALKDEGKIQVGDGLAREVRLPKNRMEFSDAIAQAKDHVFGVYNALKQKAGEQGIKIDSDHLQSELLAIGEDAGLRVMRPELVNTAAALAERLRAEGPLTPDSATSIIKAANDSYKDFLKNPSPETGGKAILDAMVANNLRKAMETAIDSEVGPGWQAYRNKYKQLSTIEKEVTKGAVVDARKSPIGLLDFTDMFSAGEAVSGIISLNPAQFAKGGTMFMIKRIYKKLKDPNTAVEKMFRMTDKQYKRPAPMTTESWIGTRAAEPPLDTSFNPETVPGRQSSAMSEIPGTTARGLEEGGYRFESPYPTQRAQTIANPEQVPGPSYRQETIDPNAPQVITRQKTVENPEQLPGKQSSYTDQEMVPQGNTNVDLMSMATKLKEFGYTPEEIQQFIPKAMKAGVPIAAVMAYLSMDEEGKKKLLQGASLMGAGLSIKGLRKIEPPSRVYRADPAGRSIAKSEGFRISEAAAENEPFKPQGTYWGLNKQDLPDLIQYADVKKHNAAPIKGAALKQKISMLDGYENPEFSVGRPTKDSNVYAMDENAYVKADNKLLHEDYSMSYYLEDIGADFLKLENIDGVKGKHELIQINPGKTKIRGRDTLYGAGIIAAYLAADDETKKQMLQTMPILGVIAYHSGANIPTKELRPGTIFHPDKQVVSEFGKLAADYGKGNKLHSADFQPKKVAPEKIVREAAAQIDPNTKGQPIGTLFESDLQSPRFIDSLINKLKEQGYDAADIYDGMSNKPSMVILDESLLNPIEAKLINNASGESAASAEAIYRLRSEKAQSITRYKIDTRTGKRVKLVGVDSVDIFPQPYEVIIQVKGGKKTILDKGAKVREGYSP